MNESLKSLIHLYKNLDESKLLLEEAINQIGVEYKNNIDSLPKDIQSLINITLQLTPEQRKALMRFIESLKQD